MAKNSRTSGPTRGRDGFEQHFKNIYGGRWPALLTALEQPQNKIALLNPFADKNIVAGVCNHGELIQRDGLQWVRLSRSIEAELDGQNILSHYLLDEASLAPVLGLSPHGRVLDMCAAPGGKALAMIFTSGGNCRFLLNEFSFARWKRLRSVLRSYLPPAILAKVDSTHYDGALMFKKFQTEFDVVVVDAPCTGERHLLRNPSELKIWSVKRTKNLAHRQMALLCSALETLKPNGTLVYSTCSISPEENEKLVERFLLKRADRVRQLGEHTYLFPDAAGSYDGCGPIFFARFQKVPM